MQELLDPVRRLLGVSQDMFGVGAGEPTVGFECSAGDEDPFDVARLAVTSAKARTR